MERRESFKVRSFEVDAFGELAPPALVGYLLELASLHATELGVGFEQLAPRGQSWVLARLRLEVDRAIPFGATVEVRTWPTGVERLFALRDFALAVDGVPAGRATSQWLVFDLEKRRAVWPDDVVAGLTTPSAERAFAEGFVKLGPVEEAEDETSILIDTRFSDVDRNLHVTSKSYVGWALEAIPLETWQSARLAALEVHYLAECMHPTQVRSRARVGADGVTRHALRRVGETTDAARAVTRWTRR